MSMKLRDLIRKVRACKTAAEERAVIAKESAMIRTAIREEQEHYRHRNVAKLLFMHMLGYPTHFGQLECMKLTASPHFPEKRIGYLGMMLLLSEEADVLMLATNSLKNDLNADNKFVAGLALCAIGNLATADMSRDLAPEVDKHLKSPMPYLRKKACLAMVRCLAKCPDMVEDFVDRIVTLLKDKSHGVLITVAQLMTQVLMIDYRNAEEDDEDPFSTQCRASFLRLVPTLVKMLRNLLSSGFSPDHDVGGISDPFLQVQLLTLLRLLGVNNEKASEAMNDVLAQVATNTETSKNAGNAILYECVQTIMGVESEDGLRVLAVNILGRFLLNRDNNIRYVALNTLARCTVQQQQSGRGSTVPADDGGNSASSALQRHRQTVVDCLKDPDISIRMRALELIYHLVNHENVETLTAELLNYLVLCPREHRGDICTRVLRVVERYSPNDRWRVDTLITMLTIAGRESTRDVQSACAVYISRAAEDIHAYATHKLLKAIRDDDGTQRGLLAVGIWCIGEYGDLLLQPYSYTAPNEVGPDGMDSLSSPVTITFMALEPINVVDTVHEVMSRLSCPLDVKHRALTCFAKLSDRFRDKGDAAALEKLHTLIKKHESSHSLELQLRSCEYDALINATKGIAKAPKVNSDDIFGVENGAPPTVTAAVVQAAKEALARMPMVDLKVLEKKQATSESFGADGDSVSTPAAVGTKSGGGDLLDFDMLGGGEASAAPQQNGGLFDSKPAAQGDAGKSDMDLLSEIFAAQPAPAPAAGGYDPFSAPPAQQQAAAAPVVVNPLDLFGATPAPAPQPAAPAAVNPMDLFGAPPIQQQQQQQPSSASDLFGAQPTPAAPAPAPQSSSITVPGPNHSGLSIEFECVKPDQWNKQKSTLLAKFTNQTNAPIVGLSLQVAVPKYVTLEMQPPTSTTVPPSGNNNKQVTQTINVTNSMLGTKNLMLKLKLGFTANGVKIDHMATQSGFPAGEY
ncbi:AP-1 complex subunit gamma-1 [Seminavis robusta]|uniref:AP-1 complex subunit gamma n=1 Tax=Seminavis robusta TaxID=568900 RepID=A0A9N8DJQ9_9STRA|nr:AP-1 complex subunit gamma-1 [Seminavis robusta]|eukprot:Sro196_g083470.1 AP-1 complex subunit gamma-1 (971) ;mRNA; r:30712-33797